MGRLYCLPAYTHQQGLFGHHWCPSLMLPPADITIALQCPVPLTGQELANQKDLVPSTNREVKSFILETLKFFSFYESALVPTLPQVLEKSKREKLKSEKI